MTYLQLVNATLRRLRRQEVSSVVASDYSKLIGDLVNLAKREVEDSWDWLALMGAAAITTVSGQSTYTLTGWGRRSWIRQVHDATNNRALLPMSEAQANRVADFPGGQTGDPTHWRVSGFFSDDDPILEVWPEPNSAVSLNVYGKISQADLALDNDQLKIPEYPALAGSYLRALDERGEDGGTQSARALGDYRIALGDAIAQDNANRGAGRSTDWRVA